MWLVSKYCGGCAGQESAEADRLFGSPSRFLAAFRHSGIECQNFQRRKRQLRRLIARTPEPRLGLAMSIAHQVPTDI